jgi:hypothetical protein
MNPTPSDVHVNTPLTNISVAYLQDAMNFVASRVFPNIPVTKQSDRYYVYDRGEFNRDEMRKRAPGTESAGGGYKLDNTPNYFCDVWAFHKDIDDQLRGNADAVINPDREATEYVSHKGLIKREKQWAGNFFVPGVWATDFTPATLWDDADGTPIEDVRTAKRVMSRSTGIMPNTLVLGKKVYDDLVDHPTITDRIKYGQTAGAPAVANIAALSALFEIERIFVMMAIENTEPEKAADFVQPPAAGYFEHAFIGDANSALLCYSAPRPGIMTPSAGYIFSWTGYLGAGAEGNRIKRFRMEHLSSDRVEIEMAFDPKQVAADLGYFFESVVTADA